MHQAAVRVLREQPARASRVLATLDRWKAAGIRPDMCDEWRRIIEQQDWDVVLENSERGELLRTGSPLSFVLDVEERIAIIERYSPSKR